MCFKKIENQIESGIVTNARDGLKYLIERGADVFAQNYEGRSVSDVAYGNGPDDGTIGNSFRGDVWDCALANSGLVISDFRRRPRRAVYSNRYTRRHFEVLWARNEHLCPYYNDEDDAIYIVEDGDDEEGAETEIEAEDDGGSDEMEDVDEDEWSDLEDGGVKLDTADRTS